MFTKLAAAADSAEQHYGGVMTYAAAAANAGVGAWLESNWFLVLSGVAVAIRIGIDLPKLYHAWKKKKKPTE